MHIKAAVALNGYNMTLRMSTCNNNNKSMLQKSIKVVIGFVRSADD